MLYKENERRFFHRTAKMADLDNIPEDPRFTEQVNRVEGTYPDNGNRGYLNKLVGICYIHYQC
jgi:hypothetical protein